MNVYFDTEFTGLVPGTSLISIGMVTEKDERFYAEFTDFDEQLCYDWIFENVIANLRQDHMRAKISNRVSVVENETYVVGDSVYIRSILEEWFEGQADITEDKRIQLVGDVCHYDMVLLANLFGGAKKLPSCINPCAYDICQDLCARAEYDGKYPSVLNNGKYYWYPDTDYMFSAFDLKRENLVKMLEGKLPVSEKHNSLHDALITKEIYEGMRR
jgi:hypothetical protein